MQEFYAYVRSKQKVRDEVDPLEGCDGNIITEGYLIAENLIEYFGSVFTSKEKIFEFGMRVSDYLGQLIVTCENGSLENKGCEG